MPTKSFEYYCCNTDESNEMLIRLRSTDQTGSENIEDEEESDGIITIAQLLSTTEPTIKIYSKDEDDVTLDKEALKIFMPYMQNFLSVGYIIKRPRIDFDKMEEINAWAGDHWAEIQCVDDKEDQYILNVGISASNLIKKLKNGERKFGPVELNGKPEIFDYIIRILQEEEEKIDSEFSNDDDDDDDDDIQQ